VFHGIVSDALDGGNSFNAVTALPLQIPALMNLFPILAVIRKTTSIRWLIVRKRNGRKIPKVRAHASSLGRIRDHGRSRMTTMQWRPFYVALELDPDDTDTSKWGNQRKVRKWISFEDLQEWHPDFMKDRY